MVFFWVTLYGLTYICATNFSKAAFEKSWLIPAAMLIYTLILVLWIWRTNRAQMLGLCIPTCRNNIHWLCLPPLALLPFYNLLSADSYTLDLSTAILMLSVSTVEEIFFRGFLLQLPVKHSKVFSIYLSSLLFSLFHLVNVSQGIDSGYIGMQVICAFASGLCYSSAKIVTGSLLPCIAAHFLTNITGNSQLPQTTASRISLWICILVCIYWGIQSSFLISKFDKEIQV